MRKLSIIVLIVLFILVIGCNKEEQNTKEQADELIENTDSKMDIISNANLDVTDVQPEEIVPLEGYTFWRRTDKSNLYSCDCYSRFIQGYPTNDYYDYYIIKETDDVRIVYSEVRINADAKIEVNFKDYFDKEDDFKKMDFGGEVELTQFTEIICYCSGEFIPLRIYSFSITYDDQSKKKDFVAYNLITMEKISIDEALRIISNGQLD